MNVTGPPMATGTASAMADPGVADVFTGKHAVLLAVGVMNGVFTAVTTALFVARRNHPEIRKACWTITALQASAHLVYNTANLVGFAFPARYPGFMIMWTTNVFQVLWGVCVMARAIRLLVLYRWNENRLFLSDSLRDRFLQALSRNNTTGSSPQSPRFGTMNSLKKAGTSRHRADFGEVGRIVHDAAAEAEELGANPERVVLRRLFYVIGAAISIQVVACIVLQLAIPDPVRIIPAASGGQSTLVWTTHLLTSYVAAGLYLIVGSPSMLFLLRNVRDANGIRTDILLTLVLGFPFFILWILVLCVKPVKLAVNNNAFSAAYLPAIVLTIAHITSVVLPLIKSYKNATISLSSDIHTYSETPKRASRLDSMKGSEASTLTRKYTDTPLKHRFVARRRTCLGRLMTFGRGSGKRRDAEFAAGHDAPPLPASREGLARVLADVSRGRAESNRDVGALGDGGRLFRCFKRFCARDFSIEPALLHEALDFYDGIVSVMADIGLVPNRGPIAPNEQGMAVNVIGQIRYVTGTFLEEDAVLACVWLSEGARERVVSMVRDGRFEVEMFDEIRRENEDFIFEDIFPKFVRAYNMKLLAGDDY
ncbi:hypothetical protein HK101_007185 [Irineochytrium annulatum]|nr:hypothetical protein HK101_007185 [Irineochytrium annulatum]